MPVKSDTFPYEATANIHVKQDVGGVITEQSYADSSTFDLTSQRITSENHASWRQLIKEGVDVTTDLYGEKHRVLLSPGKLHVGFNNPGNVVTYDVSGALGLGSVVIPGNIVSAPTVAKARGLAATAFTKNYRKTTQTFAGGVFLGELGEVARQIRKPAANLQESIIKFHNNLKSGKLGKDLKTAYRYKALRGADGQHVPLDRRKEALFRSVNQAIAGSYLEWKFGASPTIKDLDDYHKAVEQMSQGRCFDIVRVRGEGFMDKLVSKATEPCTVFTGVPASGITYRHSSEWCQVTIRAGFRVGTTEQGRELPIQQRFGVSALDIVPTLYELVPWSFFLDYFTNLGDILDAWQMRFVDFAWVNETVRNGSANTYSDIILKLPNTSDSTKWCSGGQARAASLTVDRHPSNTNFTVPLAFKLPTETSQWLNIAALAAMQFIPGLGGSRKLNIPRYLQTAPV